MKVKITNFCSLKDTIRKIKRQTADWSTFIYLIAIHISEREVVFRIRNETQQSIIRKLNSPI